MAGQAPATNPPRFGAEYADRNAQQQRLESTLAASDLNRRSEMMGNIISNAPNIAALSGVGTVDQLANMFGDAEAPIFNNEYGQQGDQLRRSEQMARLAAINRGGRGGGRGGGGGGSSGPKMKSTDVLVRYPDGSTAIVDSNSVKETLEQSYAVDADGNAGVMPYEIVNWGIPVSGPMQQNMIPQPAGGGTTGGGDASGGGASAIGPSAFDDGTVKNVGGTEYITRNGEWFPNG